MVTLKTRARSPTPNHVFIMSMAPAGKSISCNTYDMKKSNRPLHKILILMTCTKVSNNSPCWIQGYILVINLVRAFIFTQTSCMRAWKAQGSLCFCTDSPEPSLLDNAIISKISCWPKCPIHRSSHYLFPFPDVPLPFPVPFPFAGPLPLAGPFPFPSEVDPLALLAVFFCKRKQ